LSVTCKSLTTAQGDSEDLLGQWFAKTGNRSKIFLCTKFANIRGPDGKSRVVNDPAYIREACAKSHKRLGLAPDDAIDLYYCHRIDPSQPIEITVRTMAELKAEGKIRYLGLSECSAETLRRACKVHHIAAVQVEYSPFSMEIEQNDLLKTCRELGVAVVAYSPFSRGFLTGTIKSHDDFEPDDRRRAMPRYSKENFSKNMDLVNSITRIAEKKRVTPGQLTLAWLMAQGEDIIPIPGTTKVKNFDENMGSLEVKLAEEEEREIRELVEKAETSGDRYPDYMMGHLYVDTVPLKE
jgi:aryl-alcohol dehydrogenase-like predicted oxidoreductase